MLFGKEDPFGLSTALGDIQGFDLLSFLEWDLQEQPRASFHAQNSKALSVDEQTLPVPEERNTTK